MTVPVCVSRQERLYCADHIHVLRFPVPLMHLLRTPQYQLISLHTLYQVRRASGDVLTVYSFEELFELGNRCRKLLVVLFNARSLVSLMLSDIAEHKS